jgi:DNA-binding transcriptional ArsR family regulator
MSKHEPAADQSMGADPAPVFAALGDGTRLRLVRRLADGRPRSLVALTAGSTLTRQAVSNHLRVLEHAGLVRRDRVGRESLFAFQPQPIDALQAYLDTVARQWDDALGRLQTFLED